MQQSIIICWKEGAHQTITKDYLKCAKVSKYQGKSGIEKNIPDVVVCKTAIALVHKIDCNLPKYLAQRFKRYISTQDSIQ